MHPCSPPSTHQNNKQYSRKRQLEETVAVVDQSLWSRSMGRKSTAQPRPVIRVPPRGIGPTVDPNVNDVLCGRGGRINSAPGNVQFREIIASLKKDYLAKTTKKLEKAHIASKVITNIRSMEPPGRFLKEDRDTGLWFDIGDAKAIKKAGQSLREDAAGIRQEIDGDSSGDDKEYSGDVIKKSPVKKSKDSAKAPTSTEKMSDLIPDLQAEKSSASVSSPSSKRQSSQTAPRQRRGFAVSGRGRIHLPARSGPWGHQGNVTQLDMTHQDYQAQVAMPPPYSHQAHAYYNGDDQGLQAHIPIQARRPSQIYALPNQLYSSPRTVRQRLTSASREALNQVQLSPAQYPYDYGPPDGTAFGRQFHSPSGAILSPESPRRPIISLSDPGLSGIRPWPPSHLVMPSPGGGPAVSQSNITWPAARHDLS
jgi:hypothetical protein